MKFEWDKNKEKSNIVKHGVTFEQASNVFADPFVLNRFDDEYSDDEDRYMLFWVKTILVVVHTFRDKDENLHFLFLFFLP